MPDPLNVWYWLRPEDAEIGLRGLLDAVVKWDRAHRGCGVGEPAKVEIVDLHRNVPIGVLVVRLLLLGGRRLEE